MNGDDLASELRDDNETEFSRLGSSKAMYALTGGEMDGELGRYLVVSEYASQMVGFFVGDADPMAANDFRDLRSELDAEHDRVVDTLDSACTTDDEWATARDAAEAVVEVAYDDYVETLESMGIKPKNVC